MSFGVTTAGFVTKRLADIKTEIEDAVRATFGSGVNLTVESPLGQLVAIMAERQAALWELAESVYNSQYPDTASGVPLDNAVALTGLTRRGQTYSTAEATFTGTAATVIPAGFAVTVDGDPTSRFVTDDELTIGGGGTVSGTLTSDTPGPVAAPAGSLTEIETPLAGLTSVTNAEDADVGEDVETDAELKQRRLESLRRAGAGTLEAIRADILEVDEVTACTILENVTLVTDGNGIPAKSFEAIVRGGVDAEVAEAIWLSKPAGIQAHGDTVVSVEDSQGFSHDVGFSRPTDLDIYLELDLTTDSEYPATGDEAVEAAILEYGESLGLGDDVVVYPRLIGALADIPGITDITVRIGTAASPTLDDNIAVTPFQVAAFDSSRITVNS